MTIQPYVVGQWVRGERFYGRTTLIDEILRGHRNWLWLLGTRRIGKTSLLKQIEYLTLRSPELRLFPLFWDFQGADDSNELHMGFNDALLDAEESLSEFGIDPGAIEGDDLFRSLSALRRRLHAKGMKLLLLCDEVEELIKLRKKQPSLLRKLRRAMQSSESVRSVLASTIRLWELADQREDTSPFLHGFTPPLYIHRMSNAEALSLVRQGNLPSDSQPTIDSISAETIRAHCDNHPYLIQLVSKRFVELEDLNEAIEQVAVDPMVSYFFSVDFDMLSELERRILRSIAERDASTSDTIQHEVGVEVQSLSGALHRLESLGYVRRDEQRRFVLINYFFKRWFKERWPVDSLGGAGRSAVRSDGTPSANGPAVPNGTASQDATIVLMGNRYELLDEVGRGATGVVYRAHDRVLGVDIALKVLRSEIDEQPEILERFRKEIVLTLDVSHPNILPIYHLDEIDGRRCLTMKWVDGQNLAEEIAKVGPLAIPRVVSVSKKLTSALGALHKKGVLHRDVKPQNILVDRTGEPFLTDFGLVRLLGDPGSTRSGIFIGTPAYASPEQARMEPLDERSDLYSLGLVLFEALVGSRPFIAESADQVLEMHRSAPPPDPRDRRSEAPAEFAEIILRCLQKDRADRFPNATALQNALDRT